MCGYGNRVPEGWHRISDERIVVDVIKAFSRIVPDRKVEVLLPAKHRARMAECRRRREWRGTVIPEAEHCEDMKLCDTDRRVLGDVVPMY